MKTIFNKLVNPLLPILFIMIILTACEKDLEVDLPNSQLTGTTVFNNVTTARAALSQIYIDIRNNPPYTGTPNGISVLLGLYADELDYYGEGGRPLEEFYTHPVRAINSINHNLWTNSYHNIYQCNAILEGMSTATLQEEEKVPIRGEALFLRAFLHFYLVNLYGEIPYITTTDYSINTEVKRQPQQEIYDKIISDLQEAKLLLPEIDPSGQFIYASKGAADAMLARTYLYTEKWQKAMENANEVLNSSAYSWSDDLPQVFVSNGPGIIWQLPPVSGTTTSEALTFIFESTPPPLLALNPSLVNSFEIGDLRVNEWIGAVSDGGNTYYYPFKYKTRAEGAGPEEFSVMIRLAEVLLIRAEAYAHLNNFGSATADLNKVRNRAGLEDINATTTNALLTAIIEERRHELFTELGHRWFDLKRSGQATNVLGNIKPNWQNTDLLLPLPQEELILNPNLKPQNPGY